MLMRVQGLQVSIGAPAKKRARSRLLGVLLVALLLGVPSVADEMKTTPLDPVRGMEALSREQRRAFLKGTTIDWRLDTDAHGGIAPPPIEKPYPADAKKIDLVAPDKLTVGTLSVREAIRNRRSRRTYSTEPFSLEELSYLLWSTQGISKIDRNEVGQVTAHYRTVPSGGARHPFESYLLISRVTGVVPGLYRYLPEEHQLLRVKEDETLGLKLMAACYGQSFVSQAAVTFVWTAIPYRTEWKYGCIAQKLVAIEIGHVCQNLYLAIESIQGGMCAVMGYHQGRMDALLGVDGTDEFVIYLAATGKQNDLQE